MFLPALLGALVAMSATAPVNLTTCEVVPNPVVISSIDSSPSTSFESYVLNVRFANTDTRTISRVDFALNDGTTISDVGSFTTGATIDHAFVLASPKASTCHVAGVQFNDGSSWLRNQQM